jgi:hypothetical protein
VLRRGIIATVLGLMASQCVLADHLTLKNGDRLTGKIVKSDPKGLMVKTDLVGDLTVPWDAIDQLSSDDQVFFILKDGRVVAGTVSGSGGSISEMTLTAPAPSFRRVSRRASNSPNVSYGKNGSSSFPT